MTTSEPASPTDRVELEAKLTFLERTVEVMSKVMHEQGDQITRLEQRFDELMTKLEAVEEADELRPHDDPPPHY